MTNRFYKYDNYLNNDLANLKLIGANHISSICISTVKNNLFLGNTINPIYLPPFTGTTVYTVATYADLLLLTNVLNGSFGLVQNPTSTYIYDSGWIEISPIPMNLSQLTDCNITTPLNLQHLVWSASQQKWLNYTYTPSIASCSDTQITSITNGQVLQYDSTSTKFKNVTLSYAISSLSDTQITTVQANQFLSYNGSKWINTNITLASNINDVLIVSPANLNTLLFNSISGKFTNSPITTGAIQDIVTSNKLTNQVLKYNGTNFVNAFVNLSELLDVLLSSPSNGQYLSYNGSNKWVNSTLTLNNIQNVSTSSLANKDVFTWNGSIWHNAQINTSYLTDWSISSPTGGQVLTYNNGGSNWINSTLNFSFLSDVYLSGVSNMDFLVYLSGATKWLNLPLRLASNLIQDVAITSPADGDILTFSSTSNMWINKQQQIINITTSRALATTDIGNILIYTGTTEVFMTLPYNITSKIGDKITIYNYNKAKMSIITNNAGTIVHNVNNCFYISNYGKLTLVGSHSWILESDFQIKNLYRSQLLNLFPNVLTSPVTSEYNDIYILGDNTRWVFNYRSGTTRRYISLNNMLGNYMNSETQTSLYQNSSDIMTIDDSNYYNYEFNLPNVTMIKWSVNFFVNFNSYPLLTTGVNAVCHNIAINIALTKFDIPYFDSSNAFKVCTFQLSNNTMNTAIAGMPSVTITSIVNDGVVQGYHLGFQVCCILNNVNLYAILATNTGDYQGATLKITQACTDLQIMYIKNQNNSDKFKFLTLKADYSVSLWTICKTSTCFITLFNTVTYLSSLLLSPACYSNNMVYFVLNDFVSTSLTASSIVKFNLTTSLMEIAINPFQYNLASTNHYKGCIGVGENKVLHLSAIYDTGNANFDYDSTAVLF